MTQVGENSLARYVKDILFRASSYKIVIREKLIIGTGFAPDGDFKFIRRNSTGFGKTMLMTDDYSYNKCQLSLPRNMAGHRAELVKNI